MNSSSNLDKRDYSLPRSRRSARVADASRSKRPAAHRPAVRSPPKPKTRTVTANSVESASTSDSPFTFSSAANGSWVDDKDESRRVELLRRLNQISQKKSLLTVSLSANAKAVAQDTDGKRCGRGNEQTSSSHGPRGAGAPATHPRRTRFNDAPRSKVLDKNGSKSLREFSAPRAGADPMQPENAQSQTVSAKAEPADAMKATPSLDLGALGKQPQADQTLQKMAWMDNDLRKPPAAHARGSSRVRTPSVLVSSQPGELLQSSVTAYKNQQLSYCMRVVKDMLRLKDAFGFSKPIDRLWSRDQLPGYFEMISTPMDLGTVKHRLEAGTYLNPTPGGGPMDATFDSEAFGRDMRLIFSNARTYNRPGDTFYDAATRLLEKFETKFGSMPTLHDLTVEPAKKSKKRKKSGYSATERRKNSENARRKKPAIAKKGKTDVGNASGAAVAGGAHGAPGAAGTTGRAARKSAPKAKKASQSKAIAEKSTPKESPSRPSKKRYDEMTLGELNSRLKYVDFRMNNRASSPAGNSAYGGEAEALYDVPMTYEDKVLLSENVGRLSADKLQKLVTLASKDKNSSMEVNNNEEIELDIDGMNNETLRDMEAFVNNTLFNRKGGSGPNSDVAKMSHEELQEELGRLRSVFDRRKNVANRKKANGEGSGDARTKSLYDSESSSDSDESSGSSDGDSSSDEDSDSSGDEVSAETMRKRRERNLAHQQAMKAAGTPLQSPAYR